MTFFGKIKKKMRYAGKPYKSPEERKEYFEEYRKGRIARLRGVARRHAMEDVGLRKKSRGTGFGKILDVSSNVQRNLERDWQGFKMGGPIFGGPSPAPRRIHRRRIHRRAARRGKSIIIKI